MSGALICIGTLLFGMVVYAVGYFHGWHDTMRVVKEAFEKRGYGR